MEPLLCPHCQNEIEIEPGTYGAFECPHCDKEFTYSLPSRWSPPSLPTVSFIVLALISIMLTMTFASSVGSNSGDEEACSDSNDPDCETTTGDQYGLTWGSLIEDIFRFLFKSIGQAIGFSISVLGSMCCGLFALLFSGLAIRGYAADVKLRQA